MSCYFNYKQLQKYGGYLPPKDPKREPSRAWQSGFLLLFIPAMAVIIPTAFVLFWVFSPVIFVFIAAWFVYAIYKAIA